jgi:uncharacterized membrane protein
MWSLLSSIGIGGLTAVLKAIQQERRNAQNATTERERQASEERIEILQQRAEIIKRAQSDPYERFIRMGFALPFVIYIWKLVVWDKVFGFGATDALSPELSDIMWTVILGYFVDVVVKGAIRTFRG